MRNFGLLLIGHGASQGGGGPVRRLAQRLRAGGRFAEVDACFWKESPFVSEALGRMTARRILAVPVFAAEGRIARDLIPAALGVNGPLTLLPDGRQLRYLRPVGVHPGLAALAQARASEAAGAVGFRQAETALLLIAHGNRSGGGARQSAEELAGRVKRLGEWSSVRALFLEEEPRASDWRKLIAERQLVVLPLLLAEGQHAAKDLAPIFGLSDVGKSGLATVSVDGRELACACGLADDEALAELILLMAQEALNGSNPR